MSEGKFEETVCDMMQSEGWVNRKMSYVGRRSCPDRWFFKDGRIKIVEFKAPDGRLSPGQTREIRRLQHQGIRVWVISTMREAYAMLEDVISDARSF